MLTLSQGLVKALLDRAGGKGLSEALHKGAIYLYGSPRPGSSDDAETGTLLAKITAAGAAWTITDGTNGLEWDAAADGAVVKKTGQVWSGLGLATGTITWGRFYPYDAGGVVTGQSTTLARFDFSVSTSGADLNLSTTSVKLNTPITIDSFSINMPNGE